MAHHNPIEQMRYVDCCPTDSAIGRHPSDVAIQPSCPLPRRHSDCPSQVNMHAISHGHTLTLVCHRLVQKEERVRAAAIKARLDHEEAQAKAEAKAKVQAEARLKAKAKAKREAEAEMEPDSEEDNDSGDSDASGDSNASDDTDSDASQPISKSTHTRDMKTICSHWCYRSNITSKGMAPKRKR